MGLFSDDFHDLEFLRTILKMIHTNFKLDKTYRKLQLANVLYLWLIWIETAN